MQCGWPSRKISLSGWALVRGRGGCDAMACDFGTTTICAWLTQAPPGSKTSPHENRSPTSHNTRHVASPGQTLHRITIQHIFPDIDIYTLLLLRREKKKSQHVSIRQRAHARVGADISPGREAFAGRMGCSQVWRYKCWKICGEYSGNC